MDIPSKIRNPNIPSIPSIPSVAYLSLFRFGLWRSMSHLQTNQPSDKPDLWRSTSLFALSEDILLKQPVDFHLWGNWLLVNVDISWGQSRKYITSTIGDVGVFWGFGYPRIRYIQKLHLAKRELENDDPIRNWESVDSVDHWQTRSSNVHPERAG
jgi:hypothetical protein